MSEENQAAAAENDQKPSFVVASKLKSYIKAQSGMNTSSAVIDAMNEKIRKICDQAIAHAKNDGRKTVMDRDFG